MLTPEQHQAVHYEGSVAVVASAGTGKTTVLTERFLHRLHNSGSQLSQILAFTFTEAAAREMKERILKKGEVPLEELVHLQVSTMHAFCAKVLRKYAGSLNLSSDFRLIDENTARLLAEREIQQFLNTGLESSDELLLTAYDHLGEKVLKKLLQQLFQMNLLALQRHECAVLNDGTEKSLFEGLLQRVLSLQEQALARRIANGSLTFDDLEVLFLHLTENAPEILEELQSQFKDILVDEVQDISFAQYQIILRLFEPLQNKLFIVGDPKQSIYRFRKARAELFFRLREHIKSHGGLSLVLHQTFRTPSDVQTWFNQSFGKLLADQPGLFEDGTSDVQTEASGIFAHNCDVSAGNKAEQIEELSQKVVEQIVRLRQNNVPLQEIAILSTSRTHFQKLSDALGEAGIPTLHDEQHDLFNHPLFALFLFSLAVTLDPEDKISRAGLNRSPYVLNAPDKLTDWLLRLSELHTSQSAYTCLQAFAKSLWFEPTDSELAILQALFELTRSWQRQGINTCREVYEQLFQLETLGLQRSPLAKQDAGVRLYTIHGSKGLEFDHVFLWPGGKGQTQLEIFMFDAGKGFLFKTPLHFDSPNLNDKLEAFEDFAELKDEIKWEDKQELHRLMYVALTRTKGCLYLLNPAPTKSLLGRLEKSSFKAETLASSGDILYWLATSDGVRPWQEIESLKFIMPSQDKPQKAPRPRTVLQKNQAVPAHLSVTEIETFAECRTLYRDRYLERILQTPNFVGQVRNSDKLSGADLGNFLHEVLQFYDPLRDNLQDVVEQTLFNQQIDLDSKTILKQMNQTLAGLCENQTISGLLFSNEDFLNEVPFSLRLDRFILTGQIDKIVKTDEGWQVIDYKTHKMRTEEQRTALTKKFSFQMGCYALAVAENFDQEAVTCHIILTTTADRITFHFGKAELADFEKELNALYEAMTTALNAAASES